MLDPVEVEGDCVEDEADIDDDEDLKIGAGIDAVIRVLWISEDVGAGMIGVPVSETISEMLVREFEGTGILGGSVEDIEGAAIVDAVTDKRFVDVIVMVIVPTVSAIALGIPEQMLYTLLSSTASLLGQLESRHSSAASPIVNPTGVLWVHRQARSRLFEQDEA